MKFTGSRFPAWLLLQAAVMTQIGWAIDDPKERRPHPLVGRWTRSEPFDGAHVLEFKDGRWRSNGEDWRLSGPYAVLDSQEPSALNFDGDPEERFVLGSIRPEPLVAIYKVEGETLTIASALADEPRPTDFKPRRGVYISRWTRAK